MADDLGETFAQGGCLSLVPRRGHYKIWVSIFSYDATYIVTPQINVFGKEKLTLLILLMSITK